MHFLCPVEMWGEDNKWQHGQQHPGGFVIPSVLYRVLPNETSVSSVLQGKKQLATHPVFQSDEMRPLCVSLSQKKKNKQ